LPILSPATKLRITLAVVPLPICLAIVQGPAHRAIIICPWLDWHAVFESAILLTMIAVNARSSIVSEVSWLIDRLGAPAHHAGYLLRIHWDQAHSAHDVDTRDVSGQ
jgi:hypothetical protein